MNKLYRSRRDKWFTGLVGGLSEYFGISSTILRILLIILVFVSSGGLFLLYLIASLVVPKEPYVPYDPYYQGNGGWQHGGGYGGSGYGGGYGGQQGASGGPGYGYGAPRPPHRPAYQEPVNSGHDTYGGSASSNLDSMMKDIEKKAMEKELEELRKKLSKYEKGEV